MSAQGVDQHGPLPDQQVAHLVQHEHGLLADRLDREEAHGRPRHGFRDGLCIGGIGLPALDVRPHVGGRHQSDRMAELGQLARRATGFHADQAGRELGEERQDLGPA